MKLVVDASVALKWFLRGLKDESHGDDAVAILNGFAVGRVSLLQPPHFTAEVAAVLVRRKGGEALDDLRDLQALDIPVSGAADLYMTAVEVSLRTGEHLFDSLYHATALHQPGAILVTADRRYFQRARHLGQIALLEEFAA